MSIQFEENQLEYNSPRGTATAPKISKMAEFLVRRGIAKSTTHAMKIMAWSSLGLLVISILIFTFFVFDVGRSNAPDPRYIIQ